LAKTLQKDSIYNQFDEDGDGIVTDEEMAKAERMLQIENDDKHGLLSLACCSILLLLY
jgi:hypothetical protein